MNLSRVAIVQKSIEIRDLKEIKELLKRKHISPVDSSQLMHLHGTNQVYESTADSRNLVPYVCVLNVRLAHISLLQMSHLQP